MQSQSRIQNPAIVVAVRKLLPNLDPSDALTFTGTLYAEDKVIIYDLTNGTPIKRRNRHKKAEKIVENTAMEDDSTGTSQPNTDTADAGVL